MFRRLPHTLPKDPVIPPDLEKLGYFIDSDDQIRMISKPEQKYQYKINANERFNELYKEAMNTCVRNIVKGRLQGLGMEIIRLPIGASAKDNHVPILVSKDIASKKRVVVLFGEKIQDLGIFSYRTIGEKGIKVGSAEELCNALLRAPTPTSDHETPGIIIANPGQLYWYRGGARAMTWSEWMNLPQESAVHETFRIDPVKNKIPGSGDYQQHVEYVFEQVLGKMPHPDACFDLIGLEYPGRAVLMYLGSNWTTWSGRISGICLGSPQHNAQELQLNCSDAFIEFVGKRCRAYFVSDGSVEAIMTGRDVFGCNCYASGEAMYPEQIIVQAWRSMLDWFNLIHISPGFEEIEYIIQDEV